MFSPVKLNPILGAETNTNFHSSPVEAGTKKVMNLSTPTYIYNVSFGPYSKYAIVIDK